MSLPCHENLSTAARSKGASTRNYTEEPYLRLYNAISSLNTTHDAQKDEKNSADDLHCRTLLVLISVLVHVIWKKIQEPYCCCTLYLQFLYIYFPNKVDLSIYGVGEY